MTTTTAELEPEAATWPRNRRVDSRTDRLYSLRNLLRVRAQKFDLPLVVLGDSQDMLIAASEEGRAAQSMLMKASRKSGRFKQVDPDHVPDHVSHRFHVGDQELVLVLDGKPTGAGSSRPGMLERVILGAMAQRVEQIFCEPNAERPRGDEAPLVHDSGRLEL